MLGVEFPMVELKAFSAAKSADAVVVDDGPVMRKRKAVAGSSYVEGLQPPQGWIDVFVGVGTASFDPAVIDEMLHEARLPAAAKQGVDVSAAVAVPDRKHRLSKAEIRAILAMKPGPPELPDTAYLDDLTDVFSPEYIKERKLQLEAHAEACKKMDEKSEAFRQRVIKSVRENGYFELDEQFLINREKANQRALEEWEKKDFGGLIFDSDEEEEEEEAEMEAEQYVTDEDDAAILDLLIEDEEDCLIDDGNEAQGVDKAHAHKVAAAIGAN